MCSVCNNSGWVCGCTLSKPWVGVGSCGCGDSGKNCLCNPGGKLGSEYRVIASTNKDEIDKLH